MKVKGVFCGILAVIFCMVLIFMFNQPVIPIAIGMPIGVLVFVCGYALYEIMRE